MAGKYTQLESQLRTHGVDFILATGQKNPATKLIKDKISKSHSRKRLGQRAVVLAKSASNDGFFSSLERGSAKNQLIYHQNRS